MDKRGMAEWLRSGAEHLRHVYYWKGMNVDDVYKAAAAALEREAEAEEKARPKVKVEEMVKHLRDDGKPTICCRSEAQDCCNSFTSVRTAAADLIARVAKLPERWDPEKGDTTLARFRAAEDLRAVLRGEELP